MLSMPPATTNLESPALIPRSARPAARHPRETDLVDCDRRDCHGETTPHGGLTSRYLPFARLEDVPEQHLVLPQVDAARARAQAIATPRGSTAWKAREPPYFPMGVRAEPVMTGLLTGGGCYRPRVSALCCNPVL